MASWRNYYKRRYRRYYRRKYGSSYGKRSYGQMKAAKQQADQASQVINIPTSLTCKAVKTGNQERGTFALNIYDLLRKSEFYQSYANMYDEFKIDNIKVKLIPTKYNVTVGDTNGAGYQSFTVYTAWDRTGLNSKQLYLKTDGVYNDQPIQDNDPSKPNITGANKDYIGKGDYDGLYCIVGSDITTYSSAESRQISVGQNSSITRWLKPKTISEKSQWISTAQLQPWYYHYNETDCAYTYIPTFSDNTAIPSQIMSFNNNNNVRSVSTFLSSISPAIANNPCFLEEDPNINFKPTLLVGLYPFENGGSTSNPRAVSFNVETEVSITFRGLRKSKVVSNSSSNNQELTIQALTKTIVGDGTTSYPVPNGVAGFAPVTITTQTNFDPTTVTHDGFYAMRQIVEKGVNYFKPFPVSDSEQGTANIEVRTVETLNAFCLGKEGNINVQDDKRQFTELTIATADPQHPNDPLQITVNPGSYIIIITKNNGQNDLFDEIYIGVNNGAIDAIVPIYIEANKVKRYLVETNWVGNGNQGVKIPTQCYLYNDKNIISLIFGDDENTGDDEIPDNNYSTTFIRLLKSKYELDFGMEPEP